MTDNEADTTGISRRTVLKSAAWAAPVIATTVAVPVAAASVIPRLTNVIATHFRARLTLDMYATTDVFPPIDWEAYVTYVTFPNNPELYAISLQDVRRHSTQFMTIEVDINDLVPAGTTVTVSLPGIPSFTTATAN